MRRVVLICLLAIAALQAVNAQTNEITGNVKNDKGQPLHFVFVLDRQAKNAVFTDSLGNFTITANAGAQLQFDAKGYTDETVPAASGLNVVLKPSGSNVNTSTAISTAPIVTKDPNNPEATIGSGGVISPSHQKGQLHGNLYLFDTFVHGFVIGPSGTLSYNPNYLYDYDKIGGVFLLTQDNKIITQVSDNQIRTIVLYSNADQRFVFEQAPDIDKIHYVQALSSGKKYKIYKLTKTRFVKSDYVNNGVTSHGNDYDEYIDDADYFVADAQGGKPQKISLKKKSLKDAFAKDADKVNKYLSDNSGTIDDAYLSKLGDYMNQ